MILSRKVNNELQPPLTFNNVDVGQIRSQKHLGMFLGFKFKLVSAMKNVFFISFKKLFSFSRYLNFCNFFPSFPHSPDSKGQIEVE